MNKFGYCSTNTLFFKNDVRGISCNNINISSFNSKSLEIMSNKNWTYKRSMKCLEHLFPLFPLVAFWKVVILGVIM
jgi:hypothetical protein